jgi:hypothetical protein
MNLEWFYILIIFSIFLIKVIPTTAMYTNHQILKLNNPSPLVSDTISGNDIVNHYYFSSNTIEYDIQKSGAMIFTNGLSIPSDIIHLLKINQNFELVINQGRLPKGNYRYLSKESDLSPLFLYDDNLIDFPIGYLFHSKTLTPEDFPQFKNFFSVFSNVFKITLNPLLDRTSFIKSNQDYFLFDNTEKACTDHLDAIKETLQKKYWSDFLDKIDYESFAQSDFKTIKYFLSNQEESFKIVFKIIYRLENYSEEKEKSIVNLNQGSQNSNLTFSRRLEGSPFNFDNLVYKFQINKITNLNSLKIFDIIPDQLDLLISSIKISINIGETVFGFSRENINHAFRIILKEGVEIQNPVVPFSYENKKSVRLELELQDDFILKYIKLDTQKSVNIQISYELRKKLINFESYENEGEYGYKYPCGLIIVNGSHLPTNHIYFNIPSVDITMPFNIIAMSWVIFGFLLIQILNLFLTKKGKSKTLWQQIKDRFMAKWGFLFGK